MKDSRGNDGFLGEGGLDQPLCLKGAGGRG